MSDPPIEFNLWHMPWIRVLDHEGTLKMVSVATCLREAHTLRSLYDPSPLVVVGFHRLLTAITQAIYDPQSLTDLHHLITTGAFDGARLDAFAEQYQDRFDLFHPTQPFLQSGDIPLDSWQKPTKGTANQEWAEPKSIASIFVELPAATNRTLFHHVTDADHMICPACCARALLTLPPFVSAGGRGNFPSINGVPPIYVIPLGDTLFESLALSLVIPEYQPPEASSTRKAVAAWNGSTIIPKNAVSSEVGYIESLLFPARRVRLFPKHAPQHCTVCGEHTSTVTQQMVFEQGYSLSKSFGGWSDPFVAFRQPGGKAKENVALSPIRPREGQALWREYTALFLQEDKTQKRPKVVQQLKRLMDDWPTIVSSDLRFRCVGVRTDGKAKFFEWFDEALEVPPELLKDPDRVMSVQMALQRASEIAVVLSSVFTQHIRPQRSGDAKQARLKLVRARMEATYWQRLALPFRESVFAFAVADDPMDVEEEWVDQVLGIAQQTFQEAVAQVGEHAEALRERVQAEADCARRLASKRKDWIG